MNELVDLGFLAAKVTAIGNAKAKMAVEECLWHITLCR